MELAAGPVFLLRTLGALRLTADGAEVLPGRRKELVLLAYLARRAPAAVSRAELATLLWGERGEERARQSLRQALSTLRQAAGGALEVTAEGVRVRAGAVELDAAAFEAAVAAGRFAAALALWQGEFLATAEDAGGEVYRDWLDAERARLGRLARAALEHWAGEAEQAGDWQAMVERGERWVAQFPDDPRAQECLVRALHLAGWTDEAKAWYAAFSERQRQAGEEPAAAEWRQLGLWVEQPRPPAPVPRPGAAAPPAAASSARSVAFGELRRAWETVRSGAPGVVLVSGAAGSGKTRLVEEFLRWLESTGEAALVLRAPAAEPSQAVPWRIARDLLAPLRDAPGLGGAADGALAEVARLVPRIRERFPELPPSAGDDEQRLHDAVLEVLDAVAAEQPIVLFVDDLTASDAESRRLFLAVARRPPSAGILLLATLHAAEHAEPAWAAEFGEVPGLQWLRLPPPPDAAAHRVPWHRRRRRAVTRRAVVLSAVALGVLAPLGLLTLRSRPRPDQRPVVAVGVIRDFTGGTGADAAVVADMLTTHLARSAQVRVIGSARLHELLGAAAGGEAGADAVARAARQAGADYLVEGAVYRVAGGLRLDLRGVELGSGAVQEAFTVSGTDAALVSQRAAAQLAASVAPAHGTPGRPAVEDSAHVVVFPFAASVGAAGSDALADLLSDALDGLGGLRASGPREIALLERPPGSSSAAAAGAAGRLGARYYVVGSATTVGGVIHLRALLYDRARGSTPVAVAAVEAAAGRSGELSERLAMQLFAGLRSTMPDYLTRRAAESASSLAALRAFLEGEARLRDGLLPSAREAFERAVALDSGFALAQYRLAVAAQWSASPDVARAAAANALRHAPEQPAHERTLFRAFQALQAGRAREAEPLLREVLAQRPDDAEAWWQLGELLVHYNPIRGRSAFEAREPFRRVLELQPNHLPAGFHALLLAAAAGHEEEVDALARRLYADRAVPPLVTAVRASLDPRHHPIEQIEQELRRATDPVLHASVTAVSPAVTELGTAIRFARLMVEPARAPAWRVAGHGVLAHLEAARGRRRAAEAELSATEPLDRGAALQHRALLALAAVPPPPPPELAALRDRLAAARPDTAALLDPSLRHGAQDGLHTLLHRWLLAMLSARAGDLAEAERGAAALERTAVPPHAGSLARDLARTARAEALRMQARPADALRLLEEIEAQLPINYLEAASPFYALGYTRFLRAELLYELRRDVEALAWFRTLPEGSVYNLVYLGPAILRMGQIHERRGELRQAAEQYARLLVLWQEADPELRPLSELARRRARPPRPHR